MIKNILWFLTICAIFALSFSLLATATRLGDGSTAALAEFKKTFKAIPEMARKSGKAAFKGLRDGAEDVILEEADPETHIKRAETVAAKTHKTLMKEADPKTHVDRVTKILGIH